MAVISKDDLTWVRFGSAPLIVTLVLPLVIGVILLLKCILNHCCVRRTTTKEEMYGVEGRMTILPNVETSFVTTQLQQSLPLQSQSQSNSVTIVPSSRKSHVEILLLQQQQKRAAYERSESQQSHRSSTKSSSTHGNSSTSAMIPNVSPVSVSSSLVSPAAELQAADSCETVDLTDSLKRSTLHRQLPDLPQVPNLQALHPPRRSSSVLSHDGNSELYATVGEVPNIPNPNLPQSSGPDGRSYYSGKSIPSHSSTSSGPTPGTSGTSKNILGSSKNEPTPSSDSETYTLNHPYAKLKRTVGEHPYARVRTASVGGDEETDTDNYDTPHPYAQTGRNNLSRSSQQSGSSQSNARGEGESTNSHQQNILSSTSANAGDVNRQPGNPIPPRRTGRQWRRNSNPQPQDNQPQHFSGDSQDSRGYTSISVREPLSNIIANRSEAPNARSYDSHYATVSDDSEEMYAAIEDPDGNYMRISGEDGEPGGRHWHGGPNIASPIPERREANSPLPPPPPVPPLASPPELSPTATGPSPADQNQQGNQVSVVNPIPPLYAQVTKKSKKGKAPVTPTSSNNASSSQNNNSVSNSTNEITSSINPSSPLPSLSQNPASATSSTSANKNRHGIPENNISMLSPIEPPGSEPRRWSKADISYSEFEVVREPMYSTSITSSLGGSARGRRLSPELSLYQLPDKKPVNSIPTEKPSVKKSHKVPDVLDEDNYNVIPEPIPTARSSREASSKNRKVSSNSNNYQEILDTYQISNAYQEIGRKEPSDYYQEIGARLASEQNGEQSSSNLYQEIEKKQVAHSSNVTEIEDDEDLNDEFYETVKPAASSKPAYLTSPSHSQGSMTSLDRKHGYEKLKKKGSGPPTVVIIASDDDEDDEEEDENKNEDSMYERVKYPPYERLKESRDDLHELPPDDDNFDRNLYEDIGYSRVKPKSGKKTNATVSSTTESNKNLPPSDDALDNKNPKDISAPFSNSSNNSPYGLEPPELSNLDQLYARVDKTKKKKHTKSMEASCSTVTSAATSLTNTEISMTGKVESNESKLDTKGDPPKACIVLRTDRDDDISIEYI